MSGTLRPGTPSLATLDCVVRTASAAKGQDPSEVPWRHSWGPDNGRPTLEGCRRGLINDLFRWRIIRHDTLQDMGRVLPLHLCGKPDRWLSE